MSTPMEPDYKNKNITLLKDARVDAISLVDVGANNQTFFLFKRGENFVDANGNLQVEDSSHNVDKFLPLIKGGTEEDEWKVAYVVVAIPGEVDQQRDVWDVTGIRDTAHDFLKRGPLINYMHEDMKKVGELVESYLAKKDDSINGREITEGSWIIGVEPHPHVKEMIKSGKITGVSVQGSSKRADLPPELAVSKTMDGKNVVQGLYKGSNEYMQRPGEDNKVPAPEGPAAGAARLNPVPENMDDQVIPIGAVGPGVAKLQEALGLEPSGTYDEDTQSAFIELLRRTGREASPTLRMLKFILQDFDERKALEAQNAAAAAAPAPAEGATPAAGGAPMPPQGMEKDITNNVGGATARDMRGFNPADGSAMYGGTTSGHGGYPQGGTYSAVLVGTQVGNTGIMPVGANLGPSSSEDDLKSSIIQSSLQGNELLNAYLRDNLGVTDPYQLLYFRVSPSVLWAMVSAFIMGNDPRMSFSPINGRGVVTTQPSYTPPELFPTGSGYSIQKFGEVSKANIQAILDNLDYHIITNLQKTGWLDWMTPHAEARDKNGRLLFEHVVVKAKGGQIGVVTSINCQTDEVNVEWTEASGAIKNKTYKATDLEAVPYEQPELALTKAGESMVDKNGFQIEDGAIVKLSDGQVGEVVSFNLSDKKIVIETINKDIELVRREENPAEVEVINSTKDKPGDKEAKELNSPAHDAKVVAGMVKGKAGGSAGGQDPRKFGKIRFIVRSFGKWAGGKQRICVSRLRAEHPEVSKGKEESLCAWLKDQYLGTTKWRNQGKMLKTYGRFSEVYKTVVETGELDISDAEVNDMFDIISKDLGLDAEEVLSKMSGDETDFDMYLDEVFGPIQGEEVPKNVINKFVKIFKSDKTISEKAAEAEEILRASEYDGEDKSMKLEAAFTAATASIESALLKSDEEVQLREISETVDGLKGWLADYVKTGGNVPPADESSNEYIPVTWEEDDFVEVEAEPMVKRGTLSKAMGMPGHKPDCMCKMCENAKAKAGAAASADMEKGSCKKKIVLMGKGSKCDCDECAMDNLDNKPKDIKTPAKLQKGETMDAAGPKFGSPEWQQMHGSKKPRLKAKKTNLTEVNMEKADMPGHGEDVMPPDEAGEAGAEGAGDKDWVGKTVIGPDGNRYIVVDQAGDMLTVAAGRKRATFSKEEVELADAAGGADEAGGAGPGAPVEKEGGTEDKLRSAIEVLTEILSSTAETHDETTNPVGAVMKEANDGASDNSGTSLNDVIYFVNGLADQLDEVKDKFTAVGDLGPKLDQVGEMVKSVDFSEKLTAIEQRLIELEERAGASAPADTLEAVSKRLSAIEQQPGNSAQLPAQTEKVEKSASDRMFRGLF